MVPKLALPCCKKKKKITSWHNLIAKNDAPLGDVYSWHNVLTLSAEWLYLHHELRCLPQPHTKLWICVIAFIEGLTITEWTYHHMSL